MISAKLINESSGLSAPPINPKPMIKNNMVNSSGSFMADLNRTIESAPTKPKESAIEDLITVMIRSVPMANGMKLFENFLRSEMALPYLI